MKLKKKTIISPLGQLIIIADDKSLYTLTFSDSSNQSSLLEKICRQTGAIIEEGTNDMIEQVIIDLQAYFAGKSVSFNLPMTLIGTSFQQTVWKLLSVIPYGETVSYKSLALQLGDVKKARAVANACRQNPILILIPCHRVIASNGKLGGYVAGLTKKMNLLNLEKEAQCKFFLKNQVKFLQKKLG
ncbi:methylated-DNA--[protein]-cysteine S-methyltransferase [Streptococcus sp. sy018]|uniref:methylated-DNA--[protein]-cysteine S-methyltransferase n=1 Tax=Streptococcus sp. sy018 TaxID=2600147 RepID=UPI0011B4C3BC|nr:methylated-DNA--[protein]-cysteine S-methyltransferase [Streptococcus sp. sy018]TWS94246.1 methylated-DNA--[protein]-cysteine S-methyltransferase [Streptococcus sp. sy018]